MLSGLGPGPSLWAALAISAFISFLLIRSRFNYFAIPRLPIHVPADRSPDCMVVIPARNEAGTIARAVAGFPPDTVIVVDDHSSDQTAEVARQAGAGVLRAPELPRKVVGKSSACIAGARALTSRWIMFADADTQMEPEFLNAAVTYAEANALAFLSFDLRPVCETWSERLLIPMVRALYFAGARPKSHPGALFIGHCMLIRRTAYEFVGGHSAVSRSVNDDVLLAGLAQRHRMNLAVVRAENFGRVRMHGNYRRMWRGFERNASRFTLLNPWIGVTILFTCLSLSLWLPVLAWLALNEQWFAASIFASLPSILMWRWYDSPRALLAPVAIYGLLPIVLNACLALLTGRRLRWKGRLI